jgi:hypothetical protein
VVERFSRGRKTRVVSSPDAGSSNAAWKTLLWISIAADNISRGPPFVTEVGPRPYRGPRRPSS